MHKYGTFSRTRTGRRSRRLGVATLMAIAGVFFATTAQAAVEDLETDATPRWWGTMFDDQPADNNNNYQVVSGDFDGDGRDDIARLHGFNFETSVDVFRAAEGQFSASRWADVDVGHYWPSQRFVVADVNGDGRDDIVRIFDDGGFNTYDVLLSTGSTFVFERWATKVGAYSAETQFVAGDFNADGLWEVAAIINEGYKTSIDVLESDGTGFTAVRWLTQVGPNHSNLAWTASDLDGDGATDIAVASDGNSGIEVNVYLSQSGAFLYENWGASIGPHNQHNLGAGDFDGDGVADLVMYSDWEPRAEVLRGTGGGFTYNSPIWTSASIDFMVMGDFDGDGKTEFAIAYRAAHGLQLSVIGAEAMIDYDAEPVRWATEQGGFWDTQRYYNGDFDGDGMPDIARVFTDWGITSIDVHINTGAGFDHKRWITQTGGVHAVSQDFASGDFNGDGHDDIIKIWDDGGQTSMGVYLGGDAGFTWTPWVTQSGGHWDSQEFAAGDFDGDGLTDVAKIWENQGKIVVDVYRSTGTGFEPFTYWMGVDAPAYVAGARYIAGDYDGDGNDDLARIFSDPNEGEGALFAGTVSLNGGGSTYMTVDYYSIDVLRSTGSSFGTERWATKATLVDTENQLVSGDFNKDDQDDLMLIAPNHGGKIGMILLRASGDRFEALPIHGDETELGYSRSMKVVAGDFDVDGRAEVATMYRTLSSVTTNFDVWGGETVLDPSLVGAAGDATRYTPEQVIARFAAEGFDFVSSAELEPGQCTIVYPNALEESQSRDLGLLICVEEHNGHELFNVASVYGGCNYAGGQESCAIGVVAQDVKVFGKTFNIRGPSVSGCASVSREMVCGEVKFGYLSKSFALSSNNIYIGVGVYAGPLGGGNASFNNGVLSADVELAGAFSVQYSVDLADSVSLGQAGFEYISDWDPVPQAGAYINQINQGLDTTVGTLSSLANSAKNALKKVYCVGIFC